MDSFHKVPDPALIMSQVMDVTLEVRAWWAPLGHSCEPGSHCHHLAVPMESLRGGAVSPTKATGVTLGGRGACVRPGAESKS